MRADKVARWTSIRERGRRRYILVTGVLGFALPVLLIRIVVNYLMETPEPFPRLAISAVIAPVCGSFLGALMWSQNEREYHKWIAGTRSGTSAD